MQFSEDVERILREATWSPDRRVRIDGWIDALSPEGFRFPPEVRGILENLGGLHVVPPFRPAIRKSPGPFHFDPVEAAGGEIDRFGEWSELAGRPLSPIGGRMLWILAADPEANFYIGWEGALEVLGPPTQALSFLCLGEPKPRTILRASDV